MTQDNRGWAADRTAQCVTRHNTGASAGLGGSGFIEIVAASGKRLSVFVQEGTVMSLSAESWTRPCPVDERRDKPDERRH